MTEVQRKQRFQQLVLPHLDAAYNLAKWLTHDAHDAEDVVQDSIVKAFRYFDSLHGEDSRAWLLAIVRNTSYTLLEQKKKFIEPLNCADESLQSQFAAADNTLSNPERLCLQELDQQLLNDAIQMLAIEFREVLVLRELEEFSYLQIASIIGIPIGTVMSRLSRARAVLRMILQEHYSEGS